MVFVETPLFTRVAGDYLTDDSCRRLQYALMQNPERGDLIPGTGGFRKICWEDARRGKGKRGGLRIIDYCFTSAHQIWFFTIYGKNEVTDLTTDEKRALRMAIHAELDARRQQS
jgi:hypothetical protein